MILEPTREEEFNRAVELAKAEFWQEKQEKDEVYYKVIDAAMRLYQKALDSDTPLDKEFQELALRTFNERLDSAREARSKEVIDAIKRYVEKVEAVRNQLEF